METAEAVQTLRVFIVQQYGLVARALCHVLESDSAFRAVGTAPSIDSPELRSAQPDIVILDRDDQPQSLISDIEIGKSILPDARFCVLTNLLDRRLLERALLAGASGFLIKDISVDALLSSLRALMRDQVCVDPRLMRAMLTRERNKSASFELSPREHEVATLIARGLSNREIARELSVSEKTIKNHVASVFSKLNVTARTQVVLYAIRQGWH